MKTPSLEIQQFLAERKREALTIDPDTAEVEWWYREVADPYDIDPEGVEESCVGRDYFARRPGSEIWVWFGDLPDTTRERLWERHKGKLAFPAGLEKFTNVVPLYPWRAVVTYQMEAGPLKLEYCLEEKFEVLQLLKFIPDGAFITGFEVLPNSPKN
jgi:hypothetical protein